MGLNSVSCTSQQFCVTVGDADNDAFASETLAEVWDGTAWTVQPTPNPAGTLNSFLNGVSCASANDCAAVGDYDAATPSTLVEVWDGSAWTLRSTPNVAGAGSNVLFGVSCVPAACSAVGNSFTLVQSTLAESGD